MKTTTIYKLFFMLFLLGGINLTAQNNVGINTETPDSTAILDIYSENKGLLIPRLTTSQRESISVPAHSLMVFDVDTQMFTYFDTLVSEWIFLPKKSEIFWVRNNNHIYNINAENVGIGTSNPRTDLHIKGRPGQESGLTITNEDSTYSIIIVIDINDEGIIVKGDNHIDEKLLYQILENGRFGVGTKPSSLLHLKPNNGIEPSFQISNEDSTYNIIIVIDINDEGITVKGDDNENERILYSADKIGRFGVGLNNPRNVLHLKSDTINPNIRFSRTNADFDYLIGYGENSTDFIIKRMFNDVNNSEDVFVEVSSSGDISFYSDNNVNISPGVLTNEIELNNPMGPNPVISVDAEGNLDFGQTIGSPNGIISLNFQGVTMPGSSSTPILLNINQNLLPNNPSTYSFSTGSPNITINEKGYYAVNYTLALNVNVSGFTELTRFFEVPTGSSVIPNSTFVNEFKDGVNDEHTLTFHQIFYFEEGDQFRLKVEKISNGSIQILGTSNITIQKVAN